jgi:predicted DsbA family dithiol-disulfide isomerase
MTRKDAAMQAPTAIAVYSDVICPWCFVGKRRLERALREVGAEASIAWLPFELNPDMPPGGMERASYRARKFGPERSRELDANMTKLGTEEGIAFAFDRVARTPNTRKAHMLIVHASRLGRADAVVEALFVAYFEEALDIGDEEVLAALAQRHGLEQGEALRALADPQLREEVVAQEAEAAGLGVSGVPFFLVEGQWAIEGAQPSSTWVDALRQIASQPKARAG